MKSSFLPKHFLYVSAVIALFAATPAQAVSFSDPAANWQGFYAGVQLGGTWGEFHSGPTGTGGDVSGGGHGGYNFQSGRWVFGGEADISGMSVPATSTTTTRFDEDWMMTFRGRAGYAFGRYLPYATAGLALTSTTWTSAAGSTTTLRTGAAAGAGLDAVISGNWTGRLEYLFTDVPNETVTVGGGTFTGGSTNHTMRVGVSYQF